MPCRRSMIPGSRMQLWTFLADRTYQRDIKPVPTLSCGGVFRYRSGERLHGMQEVSGSIPLFSTKKALYFVGSMVLFFFSAAKNGGCTALSASFSDVLQAVQCSPRVIGASAGQKVPVQLTISSICSNTSSIWRTSVNWVRARSRLWSGRAVWK